MRLFSLAAVGLLVLLIFSLVSASASANLVPSSNLSDRSRSVGPNDLKPAGCAHLSLGTLVVGRGVIFGTNGNDLILGSSGADTIDGLGGDDCILGGNGADTIDGGLGNDTCYANSPVLVTCERRS